MNVRVVEALDLNEAWWKCLKACLEHGHEYVIDRGSFEGTKRMEFDYVTLRIREPGIRPLVPDVPPGVPPPTTMEYIEGYLPYLMTSATAENEEYVYGSYLEPQIDKVVEMMRQTPNTNQAYMAVGGPETIDMKDPPCLRGIQVRVRYGKVHFLVYFRSWDLWGGFPSNLAALQLMKEYMAGEIGLPDGELIASSGGLHLYDHAWDLARMVVKHGEGR